jgi:hypothetical protein
MRRELMSQRKPPDGPRIEEWSWWLANYVIFTGTFFVFTNLLPVIYWLFPFDAVKNSINFISSNWWQLSLLPLIGLYGKRQERHNDWRDQRQYRMLLLSERMDELKEIRIKEV